MAEAFVFLATGLEVLDAEWEMYVQAPMDRHNDV